MSKIVNARVPEQLAHDLETVASYDGVAVADLVREAISKLLDSRRADPEFKQRVLASAERSRELLEKLGEQNEAKRFDFRDVKGGLGLAQ